MTDDNVMSFAPLHGWLRNGIQDKQKFRGWDVPAERPKVPATPVVLLTRADYDELVPKGSA